MIKYKGIQTLEVLDGANKYNKWISEQFLPFLTSPALEVGAGIGNISSYFSDCKSLYLSDNDRGLVSYLKQRYVSKNITSLFLDITKSIPSRYVSFFSIIIAVNVLEHIKDDLLSLKNISKMLKKNGKLLLLVPAKQFAYTELDKNLGHYRRYEKKELIEKLHLAGYAIKQIYYFNIVGLLSWKLRGMVNKDHAALKPHQIALFDSIVPLLKHIEGFMHMPVGISLIVIAEKK